MEKERSNILRFFNSKHSTATNTNQEENDGREKDEKEDDEEDEDTCGANERCKINANNNDDDVDDKIEWIQCEECEAWWHTICAGFDELPDEFRCQGCCQ